MSEKPNETDHQANIEKLGKMIKDIKYAMFSTVDKDGSIRSRPMANQGSDFNGELWFFTKASAPKVDEVEAEHRVNVSYADPSGQTYVSMSGLATLVRDKAKNNELWTTPMKAWFPDGPDDQDVALLKVAVDKAQYWDTPSSGIAHAVGLVSAVLTGKPARLGEVEKVTL